MNLTAVSTPQELPAVSEQFDEIQVSITNGIVTLSLLNKGTVVIGSSSLLRIGPGPSDPDLSIKVNCAGLNGNIVVPTP